MRRYRILLLERIPEQQAIIPSVSSCEVCTSVEMRTPELAPRDAQVSQWIREIEEEAFAAISKQTRRRWC